MLVKAHQLARKMLEPKSKNLIGPNNKCDTRQGLCNIGAHQPTKGKMMGHQPIIFKPWHKVRDREGAWLFNSGVTLWSYTSCKKSAVPFLSGHLNPHDSKNSTTCSRGPWYTIRPSDIRKISSKRSNVSGAGCSRDMKMVASVRCTICCKHFTIWYVVELSRPVDISSMNRVFVGPTIISPVAYRKPMSFVSTTKSIS